jgi:hypothetical protein
LIFEYLRLQLKWTKRKRPWPVSRKTSEDGVKKSFLSEPKASLKDFSRQA